MIQEWLKRGTVMLAGMIMVIAGLILALLGAAQVIQVIGRMCP